jgi:acetyl esterase/lipase
MPSRLPALALVLLVALTACSDAPGAVEPAVASTLTQATSTIAPSTSATSPPAAATPPPTTTTTVTSPTNTTSGVSPIEPDPTLIYGNYVRSESFGDGLELDIHAPSEVGPWPVVVTIHGGGWFVGDRTSMGPLADGLASRKAVVFNATYHTLTLGGMFPGMVDDIACAVQFARNAASEFTTTPELVTVIGHSAGAHLASLTAYAPGEFGQDCPEGPSRSADAFVGLAGPYDISQLGGLLTPMFGVPVSEDPELWAAGSPFTWIAGSPDIPTLLLHGDEDRVAPIAFSEELADSLTAAGRDVTFEVLSGRGHADANAPRVVGDRIAAFLSDLGSP